MALRIGTPLVSDPSRVTGRETDLRPGAGRDRGRGWLGFGRLAGLVDDWGCIDMVGWSESLSVAGRVVKLAGLCLREFAARDRRCRGRLCGGSSQGAARQITRCVPGAGSVARRYARLDPGLVRYPCSHAKPGRVIPVRSPTGVAGRCLS